MMPLALIVDDQVDCRHLAKIYVSQCGYHVQTASDGDEAFELIKSAPTQFSLLLTDCMMPKMQGPALIRKLCDYGFNIETIVLSSACGKNDEPIASLLGEPYPVHFIQKGCSDFGRKLREVICKSDSRHAPNWYKLSRI